MLKAISDRIIVKLIKEQKTSVLIDNADDYTHIGVVESIGERVSGVKIGDKVAFHRFDELQLPEKNLAVIRQKSLLGIYE